MLKLRARRVPSSSTVVACVVAAVIGASSATAATSVVRVALNSVGSGQLKPNAVVGSKIKPGAVAKSDLGENSVVSAKIVDGSVKADDIASDAITTSELAAGSVNVADIAAGAVTTTALASGSVGSAAIADGAVATADIAASAVTATSIADGAVTTAKLANASVTADKIAPGTIGVLSLTDGQVTNVKLDDDSVTSSKIVDGTITKEDLASSSVESAEIVNDTITSDDIGLNAIAASEIAPNAVGASEIADGSVGTDELGADSVQTADIKNDNVTVAKIAQSATNGQVLTTVAGETAWADPAFPGARTLMVSAGGTDVANGTALVAAANTATAGGAGEWTLLLEAGTYQLSAPLILSSKVNIKGAGSELTTIQMIGPSSATDLITTDAGTTPTHIEGVKLWLDGSHNSAFRGLVVPDPTTTAGVVHLRDVEIRVLNEDAAGTATGLFIDNGGAVEMWDTNVIADGDAQAGSATGVTSTAGSLTAWSSNVWAIQSVTASKGLVVTGAASASVEFNGGSLTASGAGTAEALDASAAFAGSTFSATDVEFVGSVGGHANLARLFSGTVFGTAPDTTNPVSCLGAATLAANDYTWLDADCA